MSAGKLSRSIGLVFVLAAVFGGVGASVTGAEHGTGGSGTIASGEVTAVDSLSVKTEASKVRSEALIIRSFDFGWN